LAQSYSKPLLPSLLQNDSFAAIQSSIANIRTMPLMKSVFFRPHQKYAQRNAVLHLKITANNTLKHWRVLRYSVISDLNIAGFLIFEKTLKPTALLILTMCFV